MLYANNGEPIASVFDGIGILEKEVENLVPMLSPAYQRPKLSVLIDQLSNGTQKKKAKTRIVNIYRQDNDYPSGYITSRSTQGSNLYLQLADQFASIPVNNMVFADSGAIGQVQDKGEGWMLVSFFSNANGATAFTSADFAQAEQVVDGGDIGNLITRNSKETIFSIPDNTQNIIPTYNASAYLDFEDFVNVTYLKAANGTQYFATNKDVQALERLMQQYCVRTYKNVPATLSGSQPVAASLVNQIVSMGGTQRPLNTQMTYAELKNTIRLYTSKGGFTSNEVAVFAGSQYIADFQEALETPLIQYTGKDNTIGGEEIKGIDVMAFAFQGLNIKLIHEPILDNQRMFGTDASGFSKRSRSAIWMNTAPVKLEGGGTAPFAMGYYVGQNADIQRWSIPGSMDDKGNRVAVGNNAKKGCQVEYTWDKLEQISNPRAALYHGPTA